MEFLLVILIFQSHGKMQDYAELFDSDRKDNEQLSGRFATIKKEESPNCVTPWLGDSICPHGLITAFCCYSPEADQSIFLSSAFSHKRQSSTYR